jgi:DNA-3-methyladenine glycosylase
LRREATYLKYTPVPGDTAVTSGELKTNTINPNPGTTHGGRGPLPASFFERSPEAVAPELLGRVIESRVGDVVTAGIIVEAEAYLGCDDPGSHAATRGVTSRNEVMYRDPGTVYVYFTYGNHYMLNLVCEPPGTAGAVLIRALEPIEGLDAMTVRRGGRSLNELCSGPGKLAQALGIDLSDNGSGLGEGGLVVYDSPRLVGGDIGVSGRIGLSAGHDLDLRYFLLGSPWLSKGRPGLRQGPSRKERGT